MRGLGSGNWGLCPGRKENRGQTTISAGGLNMGARKNGVCPRFLRLGKEWREKGKLGTDHDFGTALMSIRGLSPISVRSGKRGLSPISSCWKTWSVPYFLPISGASALRRLEATDRIRTQAGRGCS
jgi:hypothetical protein